MRHTRATAAIDKGTCGLSRSSRTALFCLAFGLAAIHLFPAAAQCQTFLDATTPVTPEQDILPGNFVINVPMSAKHPVLPLDVTLRDMYPANASYGDQVAIVLVLRNTGKDPLAVPCSRNFREGWAEGNKDQRELAAHLRLVEGDIPVDIVVAVFTGSASVPGSMCTMPPGGTILIRGKGNVSGNPALEDARLTGTTLNAKVAVAESYYDDRHGLINYSRDCVSANSVPVFWLGRKTRTSQ